MFYLIELDVSAYDRKVLIAWQTKGVPCRSVVTSGKKLIRVSSLIDGEDAKRSVR
jgi:hypothetical protein